MFFLFDQANIGVSYFFILSGFVMIIAYHKRGEINFLKYLISRFARIYPVYLFAVILLLVFQFKVELPIDYAGLLLNLLALQAWIPGKALSFNTPGWSLSVEFFFYGIFPFLFNSVYQYRRYFNKMSLTVLAIWLITQILLCWFTRSSYYHGYPSKSHDVIYYYPLMHLNEFLIGNLTGLIFVKNYRAEKRRYDMHILFLVAAIIIALKFPVGLNFHDGILALLFAPLIYFISSNRGITTSLFATPPLVFLGEISYSIYILQLPIFLWLDKIYQHFNITNAALRFYVFLSFLVLFSAVSYRLLETPLRKKIRDLYLTKRPVTNA